MYAQPANNAKIYWQIVQRAALRNYTNRVNTRTHTCKFYVSFFLLFCFGLKSAATFTYCNLMFDLLLLLRFAHCVVLRIFPNHVIPYVLMC